MNESTASTRIDTTATTDLDEKMEHALTLRRGAQRAIDRALVLVQRALVRDEQHGDVGATELKKIAKHLREASWLSSCTEQGIHDVATSAIAHGRGHQ